MDNAAGGSLADDKDATTAEFQAGSDTGTQGLDSTFDIASLTVEQCTEAGF